MSDITKSKIDLKNFPDKEEAIAMILTLAKQYGLWSDQDYETIQKELQEVFQRAQKGPPDHQISPVF